MNIMKGINSFFKNIELTSKDDTDVKKFHSRSNKNEQQTKSFISTCVVSMTTTTIIRQDVPKPPVITNNTDMLTIHNVIVNYLSSKKKLLPSMKNKLTRLEWIKNNSKKEVEIIIAKKEIFQLKKEIEFIETDRELTRYMEEVSPLIEKYKTCQSVKRSFLAPSIPTKNNKIFNKFLTIAKNYCIVNIKQKVELKCENCGSIEFEPIDTNIYKCEKCNYAMIIMEDAQTFKDTDRLNMTSRYTYSKRTHFIEAMQKFQGIKNTKIDEKVYTELQQFMLRNGLVKENLTKENVKAFLAEKSYNKYYEDIALIYHTITGKASHNISHLEVELLSMFDKQEEVFDEIKKSIGRYSSLNVYYKLMKMLQILRYPCSIDDFNFLKTREKIIEHDEVWKIICEKLGWSYKPTI